MLNTNDEIGYMPIDLDSANLFFRLIARRYEKNSTIITTNTPFSRWGEIFGSATLANAVLDRLLHHSSVIPFWSNFAEPFNTVTGFRKS